MNAQQKIGNKFILFDTYLSANVSSHLATSSGSIYMGLKSRYIFTRCYWIIAAREEGG